jgi:hypothetical protein
MSSARAQRRPAGQAEDTPKAAIAAEHRISFAARLAGTENHAQAKRIQQMSVQMAKT